MPNLKISIYLNLIFLISLIAIISAYYFEYILKFQPCNLCLIERIPYALSLIILLINYKFKNNEKNIILLLIFIFIFSSIVSIYHFGIEQGFFKESLICDLKNGTEILSKEELLIDLQKITISCKDVTFRVFGLSLTTINMLVSFLLLTLLTNIFIFYEKTKH
jgi:disulfide bond formation protein DsbB|tara:strand:- start:214 stop:702 length:489 start_codon:yes stop_codon:yes gene_type:complete